MIQNALFSWSRVKAGVKTEQRIGTTNLNYKPIVDSFVAKEPITAMEMRFVLYDVFNEHIVTLVINRVEDVAVSGPFRFKTGLQDNDTALAQSTATNPSVPTLRSADSKFRLSTDDYLRDLRDREKKIAENPSRFYANSNDVERLLTVVSFVSQVRRTNGTVWKYDSASIISEIGKFLHSKVAETTLSPKTIGN